MLQPFPFLVRRIAAPAPIIMMQAAIAGDFMTSPWSVFLRADQRGHGAAVPDNRLVGVRDFARRVS